MKKVYQLLIVCFCFVSMNGMGQDAHFYKGLSYYFSAKYAEARKEFTQAETANTDIYKADIYYLNALCHYYSQDYESSLLKFDKALYYWTQYNDSNFSNYFDLKALLRYKALIYEKTKDSIQELKMLNELISTHESSWAKDRIEIIQSSKE